MTDRSILIVDDDTNLTYVLTRLLEQSGYRVESTITGIQAVNTYRDQGFDLALIDLRLPDINGLSVMEEIKKFHPEARVVIMTAFGDKETAVRAFRLGAAEYLEKPFENRELLDVVENSLNQDEESGLQGNLQMMSLASIIQVNCEERNQARLRIRHGGREGILFFKGGAVVHAEVGRSRGEHAVYELLSWEEGTFQLEMGVSCPFRTINTGWSGLLLEGMRRIDETSQGMDPDQPDELPEESTPPSWEADRGRIARALLRVPEVEGLLITTQAGDEIIIEREHPPEQEPELTQFVVSKVGEIGKIIKAGEPQRLILEGEGVKTLIIIRGEEIISCDLAPRSSVESVWKSIQTVLRRYRSNHRGG